MYESEAPKLKFGSTGREKARTPANPKPKMEKKKKKRERERERGGGGRGEGTNQTAPLQSFQ